MSDYTYQFLTALFVTSAVELLILLLIWYVTRNTTLKEIQLGRLLLFGLIGSLLTLPYIWFVFDNFIENRTIFAFVSEGFAITIEAVIYSLGLQINLGKSFLLSGICNLASFITGMLYNFLL
jgi:hypothetical protein